MTNTLITLEDLKTRTGAVIGSSRWFMIHQPRINRFADATEDHQWLHVNTERAAKESPFGGTIAHGYLTLSLLAPALFEVLIEKMNVSSVVNYGFDRMRFMAPVLAGKRVRVHFKLMAMEPKSKGTLMTFESTVEIEDEAKPALVAQSLFLVM